MKITINVDCTPEEARRYMGLPDVAPMQEALLKEVEEKMRENMNSLDPEAFMKTWMPATIQGWSEMQKMFWSQMGLSMPSESAPTAAKKASTKK